MTKPMNVPNRPSDVPPGRLPALCGVPDPPSIEDCNRMAHDRGLGVFTRLLAWHLARALGDNAELHLENAALTASNMELTRINAQSCQQVRDLLTVIEATAADDAARRN